MSRRECYEFVERFTGEKCVKLYYAVPESPLCKGLRLIDHDLHYLDFIELGYSCGKEVSLYVDHFGTTPVDEWILEENEEVENPVPLSPGLELYMTRQDDDRTSVGPLSPNLFLHDYDPF